jgi:glycosyltransferase involved in cell wall biosynthesis
MHDGRRNSLRRRLQRRIMRALIDRYATDIIACGEGSMDAVWHKHWRRDPRCSVVHDAVDPDRFAAAVDGDEVRAELGVPAAVPLFLHIGNVMPEKNHARLLAIFAAIREIVPAARLVLAGAGTNEPAGIAAREIRLRGLHDRVVTLGVRDDVPRLLKAADALLLPSLREGLPGVVLEACVAGIPTVATDLPGVREIACRLPLVRYLPLACSDREWADTAVDVVEEMRRADIRDSAARAFRASVFHIDRAVEAHRTLWHGARRSGANPCS